MLKAIAIDDEIIALERFQRIARQDENISLLGCFSKTKDAIEFLRNNEIDVVFLDIEMPHVNGLELSEQIFEMKPEIDVVFVTAYDKYALQAIQAYATGYLLKPMELDDIQKQTEKLIKKRQAKRSVNLNKQLSIHCLGQFNVFIEESNQEQIRWRTSKAEELFAFLIHHQGKEVSKDRLIDVLWPEMDVSKVNNNLHVTCHYIREVMNENGFGEIFVRNRGSYQVKKTDKIRCDFLRLLKIVEEIKTDGQDFAKLEEISRLYNGAYMDDKCYEWASEMRAWLENEYEKLMYRFVDYYHENGNIDQAIDILKKVILHIQFADEAYKRLVELHIELKDYVSAKHYYQRYEKILRDEIGISPSEELRRLLNI